MRIRLLLTIWAALIGLTACEARSEVVYFLVTELPGREVHHDSYVLPLTDPADVAHARNLIEFGPDFGAPIAVADIASGADGINRNHLAAGAPEWHWHVAGFQGFASATIEILDGNPTLVEEHPEWYIGPDGTGRIGFWNYTVTAEIPEPSSLVLFFVGGVMLFILPPRRRDPRWCRGRGSPCAP